MITSRRKLIGLALGCLALAWMPGYAAAPATKMVDLGIMGPTLNVAREYVVKIYIRSADATVYSQTISDRNLPGYYGRVPFAANGSVTLVLTVQRAGGKELSKTFELNTNNPVTRGISFSEPEGDRKTIWVGGVQFSSGDSSAHFTFR